MQFRVERKELRVEMILCLPIGGIFIYISQLSALNSLCMIVFLKAFGQFYSRFRQKYCVKNTRKPSLAYQCATPV